MKRYLYPILRSLVNYYYEGSTKEIAYEKALMVVMLLIWMNFYSVFAFFELNIGLIESNDAKIEQYLKIIVISLPFYFLIRKLFPREELFNEYSQETIKAMNLKTIIYIAVTVLIMTFIVLSEM